MEQPPPQRTWIPADSETFQQVRQPKAFNRTELVDKSDAKRKPWSCLAFRANKVRHRVNIQCPACRFRQLFKLQFVAFVIGEIDS